MCICICISPQPSVGVDPSSGLSSSRLQRSTLGKCCCSSIGKICWFVQNVDAGEKYFVGHILAQFVETTSWFAFARFSINLSVLIIREELQQPVCCLLKIQKVWTIARWLYYNILDEDHRRFPAAPPDGFSACRRVAGEGSDRGSPCTGLTFALLSHKKGPKVSWTTSHWPRKLPLATFPFLAACFWSRVLESALEMRKIHQRRCKWLFLEEETGSNWNLDMDYENHNIRYKMRLPKGIFLTT